MHEGQKGRRAASTCPSATLPGHQPCLCNPTAHRLAPLRTATIRWGKGRFRDGAHPGRKDAFFACSVGVPETETNVSAHLVHSTGQEFTRPRAQARSMIADASERCRVGRVFEAHRTMQQRKGPVQRPLRDGTLGWASKMSRDV
jgi:hypothetical protein